MRLRHALLGACLLAGWSCSDGPRVPFKLTDAAGPEAPRATTQRPTTEAASYRDAVDQPVLDGLPLALNAVRATLLHDLDGDDDRDAVALVHDAERRLRLVVATRDAQGYRETGDVGALPLPSDPSCTVNTAELRAIAPDKGLLTLTLVCGEERTVTPASLIVFSLDSPPRLLLALGERAPRSGEAPLGLALSTSDADGDGHFDLAVSRAGDPDLAFPFRDRASGLARDLSQPEASFAAAAKLADAELAKTPKDAEARADRALESFAALCREADAPRVLLSGELGIPCGKTPSRLKLSVTSSAARARARDLPGALARYREALAAGLPPDGRVHDKLKAALLKLASKSARVLRVGPALTLTPVPYVHVPALRFVDEDTLVLGVTEARTLRLSSGDESALPAAQDPLLRDPSGALAVVAVERSCAGLSLRIARVPTGEAAFAARETVSTVLAVPRGDASEVCSGPSVEARPRDLTLLGWAPQGVVCARGSEVWVVPLSADGQALGAAFALAPDAARPAPLKGGPSSRDGAYFAEILPVGIALFGPDADHVELIAPPGFAEVAASASDLALSPAGTKLAVVASGSLYVLTR